MGRKNRSKDLRRHGQAIFRTGLKGADAGQIHWQKDRGKKGECKRRERGEKKRE
jgi:hypothetical protein